MVMQNDKGLNLFEKIFNFIKNEEITKFKSDVICAKGEAVQNGSDNMIHLFPAVPNSVAIEIGRNRLPKVDLPFIVFDNNKKNGGFIATIEIN